MIPTPTQIAEWTSFAYLALEKEQNNWSVEGGGYAPGYIRAHTEQANEIAELKAKLAEVMPLAKFGALVLRTYDHNGGIQMEQVSSAAKQAKVMQIYKDSLVIAPHIGCTMNKILKD